jgi:hypothetical protein
MEFDVTIKESTVQEPIINYPLANNSESVAIKELKNKIEEHNKLLKELSKQTKIADAKKIITLFNNKISNSDLFKKGQ